jgi:hypothetical protein
VILTRLRNVLRASDLLWAFGAPVYYLLFALRHEGFHALSAGLLGVKIREVHINLLGPVDGTHSVGYVVVDSTKLDAIILAAPYIGDVVVCVLCMGFAAQMS